MDLTVLGKYGPFPAPLGACSGYLFESAKTAIVVDMGSGVFSRLLAVRPKFDISAIVLSHLHSDHMSDMLVLRYALNQLSNAGDGVKLPLTVVTPGDPQQEFARLSAPGLLDLVTAWDGMRFTVGDFTITLRLAIHPITTYAMKIQSEGKTVVYTSDSGYTPALSEFAQNADLLLCNACYLERNKRGDVAYHMTAGEAGRTAREANVKNLLCTHIWGGGYTAEQVLSEASVEYPRAQVVQEMKTYRL